MSDNKRRIDFLQIIIEIGVITIGILIAYQLNSWNENRKLKASERSILKEIRSNLELDLIDINSNLSGHENALRSIDSLQKIASGNEFDSRIPIYLFDSCRDFLFLPQTSAFETLKAKGVNLITDDSLRIRILRVYDFSYTLLIQLERDYLAGQFNDDFQEIVGSYFLSYDITNPESIQPRYKNPSWLNNSDVKTKLDLIKNERRFYRRAYAGVQKEVEDLIKDLDRSFE